MIPVAVAPDTDPAATPAPDTDPAATPAPEAAAPDAPPATAPPVAPPAPGAADEEVVVYGRLAVDRARDALVREIESLGYRVARRDEDGVLLRSGDWRGRVLVSPDGALSFSHPPIGFGSMPDEAFTEDPRFEDATHELPRVEAGVGPTFWLLPSRAKRADEEDRVSRATEDERARLRELSRRTLDEEFLAALPERLDRLATDGVPLDGGPETVAPEERRARLLAYWATRTDDAFGLRITESVERWMLANGSPPFTDAERAAWEPRRVDGRRLPGAPAAPEPVPSPDEPPPAPVASPPEDPAPQ